MAGYTRNDTSNNIATGNVINAADLDGEFDALVAAFHASTGHTHDGTAANGAPITKIGPAQDLVISTGAITPKTDNTVDLGSSSFEFKDLYIDGTANIDALVADTADINAGTIDGTAIGANSASTGAFTTLSASSTVTLSGGTADGVLYLNGSKVATSGSALTFDGTALTVGSNGLYLSGNTAGAAYVSTYAASTITEMIFGTSSNVPIRFIQNNAEQMRLTSTGLGIGASSPAYRLDVGGGVARIQNSGANAELLLTDSGTTNGAVRVRGVSNQLQIVSGNGTTATFDASGNLGLGVTPGTWAAGAKAIEFAYPTYGMDGSGAAFMSFNARNSTGSTWVYKTTDEAGKFTATTGGGFTWETAPSGTAGNAITFSQVMTLDASGNLGIGTSSPSAPLVVNKTGWAYSGNAYLTGVFVDGSGNKGVAVGYDNTSQTGIIYPFTTSAASSLSFWTYPGSGSITERMRLDSSGNLGLGGSAARATTAGSAIFNIFNGTAPVGTLTNGISLYSSSGEAYVMDAAGNATLFSPHDRDTNEWIFRSKHTPSGKVLKIDVEHLLRFVNDHFGLDAVQEFIEP